MSNANTKISVIIPVYNKEKHLCQCVDSVLAQDYDNFEILLIDDGSEDNSGSICDEYARKDCRITVIHTENRGPGAARNTAIAAASGDYFMFLDADDYWLSSSMLTDIAGLINESSADMISMQREEYFSENKPPVCRPGKLPRDKVYKTDKHIALKAMLKCSTDVFASSMTTKAVKANLVSDNGISFPENVLCMEDTFFTVQIMRYAKTYDRYNMICYAVRRTDREALTSQKEKKHIFVRNMVTVLDEIFKTSYFEDFATDEPRLANQIYCLLSSTYIYALAMAAGALDYCKRDGNDGAVKKAEIISNIKSLRQYAYILKYSNRPVAALIGVFIRIFGINAAVMLFTVVLRLYKNSNLGI